MVVLPSPERWVAPARGGGVAPWLSPSSLALFAKIYKLHRGQRQLRRRAGNQASLGRWPL